MLQLLQNFWTLRDSCLSLIVSYEERYLRCSSPPRYKESIRTSPNQQMTCNISVLFHCFPAIKAGRCPMFVVGSRLSQSTVLTASPALKDYSLSFCLLSGNFFPAPAQTTTGLTGRLGGQRATMPRPSQEREPKVRVALRLLRHVTFVDLARMCELRCPACDPSVRNLEWWSPLGLVYRKMCLFSFHSYLAA